MTDYKKALKELALADERIAHDFEQRMKASKDIALYLRENNLPVDHTPDERSADIELDSELQPYYAMLREHLDALSGRYRHTVVKGMNIAYSGITGAFANIAARKIFPDGNYVGFPDFNKAYSAVISGECDCAVLPVENSYSGVVGQVMDLMFEGPLFVNGEYTLRITQNLVGTKDSEINGVKTVISHSQALSQCERYIREHGWHTEEYPNTAVAAQHVARLNDPTVAAVAGRDTAELYGLKILDHDINESSVNTTRFAVFSRAENTVGEIHRFIVLFTVNDVAGALAKAINIISDRGFNMKVLRSRPVKDKAWQYYFYVEIEGDDSSDNGANMLKELEAHCEMLKVAGRYNREIEL